MWRPWNSSHTSPWLHLPSTLGSGRLAYTLESIVKNWSLTFITKNFSNGREADTQKLPQKSYQPLDDRCLVSFLFFLPRKSAVFPNLRAENGLSVGRSVYAPLLGDDDGYWRWEVGSSANQQRRWPGHGRTAPPVGRNAMMLLPGASLAEQRPDSQTFSVYPLSTEARCCQRKRNRISMTS